MSKSHEESDSDLRTRRVNPSSTPMQRIPPNGNDEDYDDIQYRTRQERRKWFPWKTALWALFLFIVGTTMLLIGISELNNRNDRALSMIIVGCLAFLPGSYAVFMIYGAWRKWPGYRYDLIPNYDYD